MKRLSEIEELKNLRFFVKFVKKEHVDMLLDGELYMNTLEHYIVQENTTKVRGQGDKNEGSLVVEVQNIQIFDSKTKKLIGSAKKGIHRETYSGLKKIPVFCFTIFNSNDFLVTKEKEELLEFSLDIDKEDIKKICDNFGEVAVVLPQDFCELVIEEAENQNLDSRIKSVTYHDYSILDSKRMNLFEEKSPDIVTWKDDFFKYQREIRFVIYEQHEQAKIFKMGSIREHVQIVNTETFLKNGKFQIRFEAIADKCN
ncbi:hypothetical protein ACNOIU_12570 [Exiguobacterium mexicanum]|uniref:DUF3883 domain-containing protein n=1 Tax=Exiguobacterium mexicanum TaxID=340146 RepID=A0ABT7MQS4_9BACL|nr:hypothetical protein [Exiguobacterium mexicanum]MDL5377551.1 hypothetical protein [Exiguobacterium mexicanum]